MVPYFNITDSTNPNKPRKLTQAEAFTEWTDNQYLLLGVRAILTDDDKLWTRVKDYFELNRIADFAQPRLPFIRELLTKMYNNKNIVKNNISLAKMSIFFKENENGINLLDGAITNADGGFTKRICLEDYINYYVNLALKGDREDHFTNSPEHKAWDSIGSKYTNFRNLHGNFYDEVKATEKGVKKDFLVFANFRYNPQTKKITRVIPPLDKEFQQ